MYRLALGVIGAFILAGCGTKKNPDFCCLTAEDCSSENVTELRPCEEGLACIDHSCEPASCASMGCTAEAPVCEVTTDTCGGCTSAADCARFSAMLVCDLEGDGACVECVTGSDCPPSEPICDAKQCRGCAIDDECESGACGDEGACLAEADIIYLAPTGTDLAPCSKAEPCRDLKFGLEQATATRNRVVLATGQYATTGAISKLPATSVTVHGHGATITGGSADFPTLRARIPTTLRDIDLVCPTADGRTLAVEASTTLERVRLRAFTAIESNSQLVARDVDIEAGDAGIRSAGTLTLERVRIHGGNTAIVTTSGTIDLTNVVVADTNAVGLDLLSTNGMIKFTTIARTGLSGSGTFGVHCAIAPITMVGTIVWSSNTGTRLPIDGSCSQFSSTIAGPTAVSGALATNPMFAAENASDFHLGAQSGARDLATSGPALDIERNTRPKGVGFDAGAFEAP